MLLIEAFHDARTPRKRRVLFVAACALVVAGMGAALPSVLPAGPQGKSAITRTVVGGQEFKELRPIPVNTDELVQFSKDVSTVYSPVEDIVRATARDLRTVVLTGRKPGRTSVTIIFKDGTDEQALVVVTGDISVLENALRTIAPTISAEIAPDRDAIVLSGTVPDEAAARRAVDAAQAYMRAARTGDAAAATNGQVINLLRIQAPSTTLESRIQAELERTGARSVQVRRLAQGPSAEDSADVFVIEGAVPDLESATAATKLAARMLPGDDANEAKERRIVNRLAISDQPVSVEQVMQNAIRASGCPKVVVRRVVNTEFPGDADIVVLEGSVPTQTHLVRAVTLASKIFQQQEVVKRKREGRMDILREIDPSGQTRTYEQEPRIKDSADDIRVIADESGALRKGDFSQLSSAGNSATSILSSGGGTSTGGGSGFLRLLQNQVDSNIARAKALEMADGRVVSFLVVEDLPQVRVDIKLYEINRTALITWNSQQSATVSDFNRPSTIRPTTFVQNPVTGEFIPVPNATPTSDPDVQNILGFLGGGISNRFQISGGHFEINSLLSLLEREGIARSLSNPSLTVLSGELAFFGVGGTVPVETSVVTAFGSGAGTGVGAGGVSGILNQVVERDFGIRLSVRPLVEEDGMITLDVIPSISQPDADLTRQIRESTGQSLATTAFQERSLRTSARLRDGQTLLIGGLATKTRTDNADHTPGLHEVPIAGDLFKNFSYGDEERELVIVVNPVIMREAPREAPLWAFPGAGELMERSRASDRAPRKE